MNFDLFQIGVTQAVIIVASVFGTTFTSDIPPESQVKVNDTSLIASYNLPADRMDLALEKAKSKNKENAKKVEEKIKEDLILVEATSSSSSSALPEETVEAISVEESVDETNIVNNIETVVKEEKTEAIASPSPTSLNPSGADKLFSMANEHRIKLGLPAFEKDERLCSIAESRAPQINDEVFVSGPMHKGFFALNLPYWATENIAAYQTIEEDFSFWISDYIHKIAVEGDYKYSCVACSNNSCSQIFSSFVSK